MGERSGEGGHRLIKGVAKGKMGERRREKGDSCVEEVIEDDLCDCRREVAKKGKVHHRFVKLETFCLSD